jgi:PilZ domain
MTHPASGVEISEARLLEIIASVEAAGEDVGLNRRAMRLPVEGFARIQPLSSRQQQDQQQRVVGVYDMSRTGIAIVDSEPMELGQQFNVLFSRPDRRPIEVMCSVRYSRRQGDAFIIGAEFGVSWLSALAATMM